MGAVAEGLQAALEALVAEAAGRGGELAISLRHLERGEAYDHLAQEPFVAASTIKVPILVALYAAAAQGRLRFDEEIALRAEDQVTGSGVLQVLSPGVRLPLRDLAELMIVVSDNTATNLLLERVGIDAVNACMAEMGLQATRVLRALQVVPAGARGSNTVTAGELATLLLRVAQGQAVSWDACRRMVATLRRQQLRQGLPARLPPARGGAVGALPAWELAHKTGSLSDHEHDIGLLYLPGQTIALAVLTRRCGPGADARLLIARVGRAVFDAYRDAP